MTEVHTTFVLARKAGGAGRSLSRTAIEYLTHVWPLTTGCSHSLRECAVADRCWARNNYVTRFHRDFTPTLHPERLEARMPRKPSRIGVSFTGDAMSNHWMEDAERCDAWATMIDNAMTIMKMHPEHSFLWLTKNPRGYRFFNSGWPSNAWLGASITGAESPQVQGQRVGALCDVQDGRHPHIWASYEPIMGPLTSLAGVSWLVLGGFSGRKRLTPAQEGWAEGARYAAARLDIPIWEKRNCGPGFLHQQLPKGMVK